MLRHSLKFLTLWIMCFYQLLCQLESINLCFSNNNNKKKIFFFEEKINLNFYNFYLFFDGQEICVYAKETFGIKSGVVCILHIRLQLQMGEQNLTKLGRCESKQGNNILRILVKNSRF